MRPHALVMVIGSLVAGCPSANDGSVRAAEAPAAASPISSSSVVAPSASASADGPACEALFGAPPGADPLCDEHVVANGAEIHWRSFATKEARAAVNQRARERSVGCGFGLVAKPPLFDVADGARRHFETYEASAGGFPRCEQQPTSAHQTVIVISELTRGR